MLSTLTKTKPSSVSILRNYPVALYPNEKVTADNQPANPKQFPEPLTVELLQKHQNLVKGQ